MNESLQGDCLGTRYDVGVDMIAIPILDSDDCDFADQSSTGLQLFIFMLVAFLAADVGLIDFDRSAIEIGDFLHPALPDPLSNEPSDFLSDAHIPMKIHGLRRPSGWS